MVPHYRLFRWAKFIPCLSFSGGKGPLQQVMKRNKQNISSQICSRSSLKQTSVEFSDMYSICKNQSCAKCKIYFRILGALQGNEEGWYWLVVFPYIKRIAAS